MSILSRSNLVKILSILLQSLERDHIFILTNQTHCHHQILLARACTWNGFSWWLDSIGNYLFKSWNSQRTGHIFLIKLNAISINTCRTPAESPVFILTNQTHCDDQILLARPCTGDRFWWLLNSIGIGLYQSSNRQLCGHIFFMKLNGICINTWIIPAYGPVFILTNQTHCNHQILLASACTGDRFWWSLNSMGNGLYKSSNIQRGGHNFLMKLNQIWINTCRTPAQGPVFILTNQTHYED